MKALVTGHAGFVGRHMCAALETAGWDVYGIDIAEPRRGDSHWWRGDARDFFRSSDITWDLVVHLAAVVGGRALIEGDPLRVAQDLAIDADMFRWALRTRPGRVVYYSSSAVYPVSFQNGPFPLLVLQEDYLRWDDDHLGTPDMTYGWAKLSGEVLAGYARAEGLRVQVFRPFSGYGTDQALDYPFPSFIRRARERQDPFQVWGDGRQVRDWIHIDDVITATLIAVDEEVPGPVNLCTGRATSFDELAGLVTAEAGYSPVVEHLTGRPSGVARRVGDPTRMRTFYTPRVTLEEGIRRALAD